MKLRIDLNCDLGEGMDSDAGLMDLITSASIACGFHAGDPTLMRQTARLAMAKGISIGAHPGFPDRENFGRQKMQISAEEVIDLVVYQIGALKALVEGEGGKLSHVKPHGALYNMAASDPELARAIALAVRQVDPGLVLYALAGSEMIKAAHESGLKTAAEVFIDRTYQADGSLTPRSSPDALVTDPHEVARRALFMVKNHKVITVTGKEIKLSPETICIHGDSPHALEMARAVYNILKHNNIQIKSPL